MPDHGRPTKNEVEMGSATDWVSNREYDSEEGEEEMGERGLAGNLQGSLEHLPVPDDLSPMDASATLSAFMNRLFGADQRTLEPEKMLERLHKAEVLMNSLDNEGLPEHSENIDKISRLLFIAMETDCNQDIVKKRNFLTGFFETDVRLKEFFRYFNSRYYEKCASELERIIERNIPIQEDLDMDQNNLRSAVRESLGLSQSQGLESPKLQRDRIILGSINHVNDKCEQRRPDESIEDYAMRFFHDYNSLMRDKCRAILLRFEYYLLQYRLLVAGYPSIREFMKPRVISSVETANICSIIAKYPDNEPIFGLLMGQTNDGQKIKMQLSLEGPWTPRKSFKEPHEVRESLFILMAIEKAQEEFYYKPNDFRLVNKLYNLSQVETLIGCDTESLESRVELSERYAHADNIARYLKHFNSQQIIECLPVFESQLGDQFFGLSQAHKMALAEIRESFKSQLESALTQDPKTPRLFESISPDLATVSLANYLINRGVRASKPGETLLIHQEELQNLKYQINKYLGSALFEVREFYPDHKVIELINQLDPEVLFLNLDPESLIHVEDINICHAVAVDNLNFDKLNSLIAREKGPRKRCLGIFCLSD